MNPRHFILYLVTVIAWWTYLLTDAITTFGLVVAASHFLMLGFVVHSAYCNYWRDRDQPTEEEVTFGEAEIKRADDSEVT